MNMQVHRTNVAVLAGGPDAEREVSLMSGREIAAAIDAAGRFAAKLHVIDRLTADDLSAIAGDVIFPALHGPWGEGGPLQRLLEADGRPFVGCGSVAAEIAMDKMRTKEISQRIGVATPPACVLTSIDDACPVEPPLVLKPIDDGSSVDVLICRSADEVRRGRTQLHPRRKRLMAEKFIPGRELTVGLVGDRVGSLIEIIPSVEFYDYEAKYTRDDTRYTVNPDLPAEHARRIKEDSLRLYRAIGCRDLARIDFRYDDATDPARPTWWMLEVNTMPGFTSHSLVPMGEAAGGAPMPLLCTRLVEMALGRGAR
ncbi:MAG: D-alanine--D-alanine ligase [Phycisphaerales bacterium]|nr:D-alanine--D-alanine ligase [Phycisphaerales bacterium]